MIFKRDLIGIEQCPSSVTLKDFHTGRWKHLHILLLIGYRHKLRHLSQRERAPTSTISTH